MGRKNALAIAADDRAQIPFAVIGVLLLVTSVSIVVVLETRSEPEVDTDAAQAYDRTSSAVRSVVQGATTSALQNAAAQPVTVPNSSTTLGQALAAGPSGGSDPDEVFSRYVQLRMYLALQERLGHTNQSIRQDTVTRVSMPEYSDPAEAIDALTLQVGGEELDYADPGGSDLGRGAVRVTVPDVEIVVEREGTVVGTRTQDYTVTVGSSVFVLHDRTNRYEEALNTDLGDENGFARHLSARLTRMGWQRGHAQANGSPVAEVIGERHLETLANDAAFATQREVYGNTDPYRNRTLTRAYGCMLSKDHHGIYDDSTGGSGDLRAVTEGVDEPGFCSGNSTIYERVPGSLENATAPSYTDMAGENDFLAERGPVDLDEISETAVGNLETNGRVNDAIDCIYTVGVGVENNLTEELSPAAENVESPGPGWSVRDERVESVASYRIHHLESERVLDPDSTASDREYYRYEVTYSADVEREITWENGAQTRSETGGAVLIVDGTFTVTGQHHPDAKVDDLGIEHDYDSGPLGSDSSLYDTNYEGVPEDAVEAIFRGVDDEGTAEHQLRTTIDDRADRITGAEEFVRELTVGEASTRIHPEPEDRAALHGWLIQDLRTLQGDTSTVSVSPPRYEYFQTESPLDALGRQIAGDDRIYAHVDGGTYTNVPGLVRAEVRQDYMESLRNRVDAAIAQHEREMSRLDTAVSTHSGTDIENATSITRADLDATPYAPPPYLEDNEILENVEIIPDGEPTFLTFDRIDAEQVPAAGSPPDGFAPVAGQGDNVYGVPSTDVTTKPGEVHLRTAGELLEAAKATDGVTSNANWDRGRTDALERSLQGEVDRITAEAADSAVEPFAHISAAEMRSAIRRDLADRGTLGTRATVLVRGEEGFDEVAASVARSFDRPDDPNYDYYGTDYYLHLETSVRYGLRDAVGDGIVDGSTASLTIDLQSDVRSELEDGNRAAIRERLEQASSDGLDNESETSATQSWLTSDPDDAAPNRVPSGLVTVDRPALNLLTTNVWNVHLRGEYARFVVKATSDRDGTHGRVTYVREDRPVTVTYDGTNVTTGRSEALRFETNTSLLVAVPDDSFGVGDRTPSTTWCSESYDVRGPVAESGRFDPCSGS